MAWLRIEDLVVRAGGFRLWIDSLALDAGRTLVLLGPSGAGKTMLLETLAGFRAPATGRILLGDRDITGLPPEERRIGLMFQDYALFPHLNVLENVRFGLRARGVRDAAPARAMLARIGIEALAGRRPGSLSGGERQRVALARALVVEPRLLLLDEPLSALDTPTRDELRESLRRLLAESGVAALYVTHDQAEAVALADDLAIILGGRVRQTGPVRDVYDQPADTEVARFLGMESLGTAQPAGEGCVEVAGVRLAVARPASTSGPVAACYRAEDVLVGPPAGDSCRANSFEARVTSLTPLGPLARLRLDGPAPLSALVFTRTALDMGLREGAPVRAVLPPDAIRVIPIAGTDPRPADAALPPPVAPSPRRR